MLFTKLGAKKPRLKHGYKPTDYVSNKVKLMLENNNQPHDYYFRSMMDNINNAKGLLSRRLSEHIKQIVDLNSLKACKETYIDEDMKKISSRYSISG